MSRLQTFWSRNRALVYTVSGLILGYSIAIVMSYLLFSIGQEKGRGNIQNFKISQLIKDSKDEILNVIRDSRNSTGNEKSNVTRPSDCGDLDKSTCKSGIYKIFPGKTSGFNVFCEMEKYGGGWTVFQRRMNGKTNFFRGWDSYKEGFGNQNVEFWLGNDHLHQLTSQGNYKMRIDMEDFENNKKFALYTKFTVGSESSGYVLGVSGYSGDAGDSMTYQNGQKFSTKDKDNDKIGNACSVMYSGAWWYNKCHFSNLNGLYLKGKHQSFANGISWKTWKGYNYSLKETVMMIRKA